MSRDNVSRLIVLVVIAVFATGCGRGPERVPVAGQVLIDGKPLTSGEITVAPQGMRAAFSTIDSEGRFKLSTYEPGDGTSLGTHPVSVHSGEFLDPTHKRWNIPKKYANLSTSGLDVTIDGPTDSVVINLSWEGGKPFVETIHGGE